MRKKVGMEPSARNPDPALDRTVLEALDACRPSKDDASSLSDEAQRLLRDDPRYAAWFITRLTGDETAAHGAAWQRLLAA